MTPQELKNSILQLAIQGKLVEQRPEEGTAEELYQEIQEEKRRLIKEGKIKKEKGGFGKFKEDEILFDIPSSWMWVRFGELMINRDSERIPLSTTERSRLNKVYDYYGASGVIDKVDNYLFDKKLLLIGEDGANLLARSSPIAYLAQGHYWVNNHAHVLDCNERLLSMEYVMYFINAINLSKYVTGTAQPKMNQERMNSIPVSLPPFAEQKRIVAKIEELLPYIDRYEQAWGRLEEFNKRFPLDLHKSILQLAIQGNLVEHRPEEGTAEELYQQIQAEKRRLIKEGKIRGEKTLPEITADEMPFEIPENWKWVRLNDIIWFLDSGKSPNCQKQSVIGDEWGVITTTSVQIGFFDDSQNKTLPPNFVVKESMQVKSGDILITRAGPTNRTGIACLVKKCRFNLILSDKIIRVNMTNQHMYKDYIVMALNSPQVRQAIIGLMSGMDKQQVNISQDKYKALLLPIPPLAEQKRIVAKLEELLPLCERLNKG